MLKDIELMLHLKRTCGRYFQAHTCYAGVYRWDRNALSHLANQTARPPTSFGWSVAEHLGCWLSPPPICKRHKAWSASWTWSHTSEHHPQRTQWRMGLAIRGERSTENIFIQCACVSQNTFVLKLETVHLFHSICVEIRQSEASTGWTTDANQALKGGDSDGGLTALASDLNSSESNMFSNWFSVVVLLCAFRGWYEACNKSFHNTQIRLHCRLCV